MALSPGDRVGNIVVESVLGRGGMATVYRVRHEDLGASYALKVLDLVTPGLTARFVEEGRIQASIRHANVVTVFDVREVEGRPALLMELVEGGTLSAWIRSDPPLSEVERVFRGIVAGVGAAHDVGLVHRDLKPGNVLLSRGADGRLVPRVADFGVARRVDGPGTTRTGLGLGTPGYMAPEQFRNAKAVDRRADIFSLGVVLYELVCGERPFSGFDSVDILQAASSEDYELPSRLRPEVDPRIEATIRACLVPDPERRLPDTAAVLACLDGQDVAPTADPTWIQGSAEPAPTRVPSEGATVVQTAAVGREQTRLPKAWIIGGVAAAAIVGGAMVGLGFWMAPGGSSRVDAPAAPASVVVRPFAVQGADESDWLGTSLAEDLTFALAASGGPRVVSQSALQRYEQIPDPSRLGSDLGVEGVVEGRVQVRGDSVTVRTSLVRTADDAVVWTQSHTGPIGVVGGSEGRVVQGVLEAFGLPSIAAGGASPTRQAALPDYLLGREIVRLYDESRYDLAEAALERAIATDPGFADARATLARLYLHRGWHGQEASVDLVARAEAQVREALTHEPANPRALSVLGRAMAMRGELRGAYEVLNLAIGSAPDVADAYIDRYEVEVRAGAFDLAARDLQAAEALDPFYLRVLTNQAWLAIYDQRYEDQDAVLARARERGVRHYTLDRARGERLRRQGDQAGLERFVREHDDPLVAALAERDRDWLQARIAQMAPLGPERPNGVVERARYEAALGRTEQALDSLRIALAAYPGYLCHTHDPLFDEVKQHAGWEGLRAAAVAESADLTQTFADTWSSPGGPPGVVK